MAASTDIRLRDQQIYSVYVRNHTPEGTFRSLMGDLERIKALGTDIIWLMPIHPIGVKGKKGSLGCPYSIRDYRAVNPEYGTMEDFRALVEAIHALGMKCIIDVVYNHSSRDSVLLDSHPEFYFRMPDGSIGNQVGDWSDVADLDYHCAALWDYQIETLCMWAEIVDGFRCDVASFVPVEFWLRAREAVEKVRPGAVWLGETVHGSFAQLSRRRGMYSGTDYDMFAAFDMQYDYDIRETFDRYMAGKAGLSNWIDALNYQEWGYPAGHIKMRCLENHDQPRICSFVKDDTALENFTALLYFLKGTTMLYGGQEYRCETVPSLFDKDVFERDPAKDISGMLTRLRALKRELLSCEDHFKGSADDAHHIAILRRDDTRTLKLGIFSLRGESAEVAADIPDGEYREHISGGTVKVSGGKLLCTGRPILITLPSGEDF